jgi:hypothetical protein
MKTYFTKNKRNQRDYGSCRGSSGPLFMRLDKSHREDGPDYWSGSKFITFAVYDNEQEYEAEYKYYPRLYKLLRAR